jgi:hypothetical protein
MGERKKDDDELKSMVEHGEERKYKGGSCTTSVQI